MKGPPLLLLCFLIAGCSTYERPAAHIIPVPEPKVKNAVESIPQAAEFLVNDLVTASKIKQRIRVAFLAVDNRYLDAGVSKSIENALRSELVARDVFDVLKDVDLKTIRKVLALEDDAAGFLDSGAKVDLGRRLGADAVITCTVSDSIQHWQIYVDVTPITSNVLASGAACYLPKSVARRSQIYTP
jgi:hypothetical protein